MKLPTLRRKRVIIPAVATLALVAVGATVWTATADDVRGDERDRVAAAAVEVAGGGEAVEVEQSDDAGEAYEVEVRMDDGTEVDVTLDEDLAVVTQETDDRDDDGDDDRDDDDGDGDDRDGDDGSDGDRDADDRVLGDAERAEAEKAALAAVGGGTLIDLEASDDMGVAYDAEVRDADGIEWDVELDADYAVVTKTQDR